MKQEFLSELARKGERERAVAIEEKEAVTIRRKRDSDRYINRDRERERERESAVAIEEKEAVTIRRKS